MLGVLSAAQFLTVLDLWVVNIALPTLQHQFAPASLSEVSWILDVYAIVLAALLLPAGRAADRIGRRTCFLTGLAVFGDAKYWWSRAKNLYARATAPVEDAVMVFSGSMRLKRGHVAVVTHIVSRREIRVDQANWQNHGEIDLATPVLDVSAKNDWSKVRVWDIRSGTFGAHVYAISGFIAKEFRTASRD